MKLLAVALLALALAGCGAAAPAAHPARTTASHGAASAAPARTYPDQAADTALCTTYNADIQTGDTYDIGQALQQAEGTVSTKLATDIQTVVNGGSLQTDLKNQVAVAFDCALAKNGVPPGNGH